jgi:outer membrane protein assembly factor BamA
MMPSVRAGWGDNLPLELTFPLGGTDGFPGLEVGRIRGDRELSAKLGFALRVAGPVDLRLEGAAGQAQFGGSLFGAGPWEYGGRIGLGAATPVGPVRVDYGIARTGEDGFFIRLGEWF